MIPLENRLSQGSIGSIYWPKSPSKAKQNSVTETEARDDIRDGVPRLAGSDTSESWRRSALPLDQQDLPRSSLQDTSFKEDEGEGVGDNIGNHKRKAA